ncbi:MAG: hypothetical protein KY455_04560 [Euryarchaeota archaeon]|nr:hypothetical protein [Euryarchaeota archaeon]
MKATLLTLGLVVSTIVSGCVSNQQITLPEAAPPRDWADLGRDRATAYDCLLLSARAIDQGANSTGSHDTWNLKVGQEDRIRLQVAALRADAFDSIALEWDNVALRHLAGVQEQSGDFDDRSRLADGRTAWQAEVEVTVQAAQRGTHEVAGSLVPRGGGGAITCAPAAVTVG